jgi:hypothetical protein
MMEKNLTRLKWKYVSHIKMHRKETDSGKLNYTELVYDETKWFCSVLLVGISGPAIQRTIRVKNQKDSASLIRKIANGLDFLAAVIEISFPKI